MASYSVTFRRSAIKDLRNLPTNIIKRVEEQIERLAENPHMRGVKKLEGEERTYRRRIGDYRIVFDVYDETRELDVLAIQHRNRVYRTF